MRYGGSISFLKNMSKNSKKEFAEYVAHDLLDALGGVTARAMFGGFGIYKEGIILGIIVEGRLYFKVDDSNRADYVSHGMKAFVYEGMKGKKIEMGYWEVPEEIMEQSPEITEWARKAWIINKNAKAKKKR